MSTTAPRTQLRRKPGTFQALHAIVRDALDPKVLRCICGLQPDTDVMRALQVHVLAEQTS